MTSTDDVLDTGGSLTFFTQASEATIPKIATLLSFLDDSTLPIP